MLRNALLLLVTLSIPAIVVASNMEGDNSGSLEVTENGEISISPARHQNVLLNGQLQLNSVNESSTINASLINRLLATVSDLMAQNVLLQQNLTFLLAENAALQNRSYCSPQTCSPGVCSSVLFDYRCICPPGWTGKSCDFYVGSCGNFDLYGNAKQGVSLCHPEGTCVENLPPLASTCACPSNRTGLYCEVLLGALSCSHLVAAAYPFVVTSGAYLLDVDGANGATLPNIYNCDMTTDGGGWTIIAAYTGANNESPLTADALITSSNPLIVTNSYYNLDIASKELLSTQNGNYLDGRGETLIKRRTSGVWIRTSSPPFNGYLRSGTHKYGLTVSTTSVVLQTSAGQRTSAIQGYTTRNIAGGGDFGLVQPELGFDFFNANATMLNNNCYGHYFYSSSDTIFDGDAGYDTSTAFGTWSSTQSCSHSESGHMNFYAAVRDPTLFLTCAASPCKNNGVCVPSGSASVGYSCTCKTGYSGHHCEIAVCTYGTHTFNGKCLIVNPNPSASFSAAIVGCKSVNAAANTSDFHLASARGNPSATDSRVEKHLLVDQVTSLSASDASPNNFMWTSGFQFLNVVGNAYFSLDGTIFNAAASAIPWSSSYPKLVAPTTNPPSWPIVVATGGSSTRYRTIDASATSTTFASSVCARFQQPNGRCQPTETYFQNSCYSFNPTQVTFNAAESWCEALVPGARLVTIETLAEHAFLVVQFNLNIYGNAWIGMASQANQNYVWTSGSSSAFRFWDVTGSVSQPESQVGCVNMWAQSASMAWDDVNCIGGTATIVCERAADMNMY